MTVKMGMHPINPTSAIELRHALLDAEINQVRVHLTDCFQVEV